MEKKNEKQMKEKAQKKLISSALLNFLKTEITVRNIR